MIRPTPIALMLEYYFKTLKYLAALSGIEFSSHVFQAFQEAKGLYPIVSLVRINDNSVAFVVPHSRSSKFSDRPKLVLVNTSAGEDLKNTPLIDLRFEPELRIDEDLDPTKHFDQNALEKFAQLNIVL